MCAAFWGLIGIITGTVVAIIALRCYNKRRVKMKSSRLLLYYLYDKKSTIEDLITKHPSFRFADYKKSEQEINEWFKLQSDLIRNKPYLFVESEDFKQLQTALEDMPGDDQGVPSDILRSRVLFTLKTDIFLHNELLESMHKIVKLQEKYIEE